MTENAVGISSNGYHTVSHEKVEPKHSFPVKNELAPLPKRLRKTAPSL